MTSIKDQRTKCDIRTFSGAAEEIGMECAPDPLNAERERMRALMSIDNYCVRLHRRGRRPSTIASYRCILKRMVSFLSERGLHTSPEMIGEREISAILNDCPNTSDLTKKNYLGILSRWMMLMADNGTVIGMDLLWPSSERPGRIWADTEDAFSLLEKEKDPLNRLILLFAMDEGMRASEISAVRTSDIKDGWITIRGKGHGKGKLRTMPLTGRVESAIREYVGSDNRMSVNDNEYLLLSSKNLPLTGHAVSNRVRRMSNKYGYRITAHSLRRRFITDTLNSGVRIEVCSRMVGHENPMITSLYFQCGKEEIEKAMERRNINRTNHYRDTSQD